MRQRFPTWLCRKNKQLTPNQMPVDQHQLIPLIVPRPVCVSSAANDLWADPKGKILSVKYAEPAYKILGACGLDCAGFQEMEEPLIDTQLQGPSATMGCHCRAGVYDVLAYDWDQYLAFAEKHFGMT